MTPLIRFALGLAAGGLAVRTLRNTVFQDRAAHGPSDAPPDSRPAAAEDAPPAMDEKRAATPARKRGRTSASRNKTGI